MKVKYTSSTGCPLGQFVVYAENEQERAILKNFVEGSYSDEWKFWRHGASYRSGENGPYAFNFGYIKNENQPNTRYIKMGFAVLASYAIGRKSRQIWHGITSVWKRRLRRVSN